jgi:integrative and conjugative element protein (TIGR02256 family)
VTAPSYTIFLARAALDTAVAHRTAAFPTETGGILLGFRAHDLVVVTRVHAVADPRATRFGYLRHRRRAQARMAVALSDALPVVGYVGEWHTHPADAGPSKTDLRAVGATARLAEGPVALIVLAGPDAQPATVYGAVAVRQDFWPIAAINPVEVISVEVDITDDSVASLEVEAAALTERERS